MRDIPLQKMSSSWLSLIGRLEPITVFDQSGVHVSLHFAKDTPPGHSNVAVVIVSTVNTSPLPVKDFMFQAAVPKVTTSADQRPCISSDPSYSGSIFSVLIDTFLLQSDNAGEAAAPAWPGPALLQAPPPPCPSLPHTPISPYHPGAYNAACF